MNYSEVKGLKFADFLLETLEEEGCVSTVHLNMVELKRDGQCRFQPVLAIFAPHHHRVGEFVGVLVDNAVEFCMHHG